MRSRIETLENRRLLSVSVAEAEPNNTSAMADAIMRDLDHGIEINARINTVGDHDWFKLQLKKGDILGAATTAGGTLNPKMQLANAAGVTLFADDDSNQTLSQVLPEESPLPRSRRNLDAEVYYVISAPGTYYLEVSASDSARPSANVGRYELDVRVARPAIESQPVGAHQILFLDFDGAIVDYSDFAESRLPKKATLSPMSSFLTGWGLTAADENAVIDGVVARMKELLSDDIRANGLNGDYASTGQPGNFDIEIRNSRDQQDTWGIDPLVSRVVIGGTAEEAGLVGKLAGFFGENETNDIGNFKTNDQAVASLSWITDGIQFAGVGAVAPVTQVDLVATGIAVLAAHEVGHIFGCGHTDQPADDFYGGLPNVMDRGVQAFIGPDLLLGTADDRLPHLGVDGYNTSDEGITGINDTLNTVAFGLSTGKGISAESAHLSMPMTFSSKLIAETRDPIRALSLIESSSDQTFLPFG
ncbi:MAG TPA: hypothetical protein VH518_04055 [Tepidisphaeraceae bacterium]|jgi:hypothetical protein